MTAPFQNSILTSTIFTEPVILLPQLNYPFVMAPHPLDILSAQETNSARDLILSLHPDAVLSFREIYLEEPPKVQLIQYLTAEHSGRNAARPHRTALVQYDVIGSDRVPEFHEAVVDLDEKKRISHAVVDRSQHASLTL